MAEDDLPEFPYTVLHDLIVVDGRNNDVVSAGGILIPDNQGRRPNRGRVVQVGALQSDVKRGDEILFKRAPAMEFDIEGVSFLVITPDDLVAVQT